MYPVDKNKILVYLGANANEDLMSDILAVDSSVGFVTSNVFSEVPRLLDGPHMDAVIPFDIDIHFERHELGFASICGFNVLPVMESVMSDKNLSLLWTRFSRNVRLSNQSEVKRQEVVYSLIKCAIKTCLSLNPNVVFFSYEPHMLPMYIFKKVVVALGIQSYTLTISPFVWRLFCEEDGKPDPVFEHNLSIGRKELGRDSVGKMIAEKQGAYEGAKPFYEKRKLGVGFSAFLNKMKVNGWSPTRTINSYKMHNQYQELSSPRVKFRGKKYVSFFLQYQPEQTTLPDGGLFVNQLFAIQMLYSALSPLGVSLVVREHPATFESIFDSKWRSSGLYRTIKNIGPGIYLDDINQDPFSLVEDSVAVSSVTGTVLLEGMLKGKPAIAFGKTTLRGFSDAAFVEGFTSELDLRRRCGAAFELSSENITASIESYLFFAYSHTYGDVRYVGNDKMAVKNLKVARYSALLQVLDVYCSGQNIGDCLSSKIWSDHSCDF